MAREVDGPGSPEQRLHEVLGAYLEAAESGREPDRRELLARHADLAAELEAFFTDHDRLNRLAAPLPAAAQAGGPEKGLPDPPPGFELLRTLGAGGMGVVYLARDLHGGGRLVALKMVRAGGFASPREVERFVEEMRAHARLQHDDIVRILAAGAHRGMPYFTMDLMAGGSLQRALQGTPLPSRRAA